MRYRFGKRLLIPCNFSQLGVQSKLWRGSNTETIVNIQLDIRGAASTHVRTDGAHSLKLVTPKGKTMATCTSEAHAHRIMKSFRAMTQNPQAMYWVGVATRKARLKNLC